MGDGVFVLFGSCLLLALGVTYLSLKYSGSTRKRPSRQQDSSEKGKE